MSTIDAAMYGVHLLFAGLWAGAVVFVTYGVLPTAVEGSANAEPLASVVGKLQLVSRVSAVALLLSGGHLAGALYTVDSLTGDPRGHLVLAMVALWLVLAGLVEVGASKLADGFDRKKVRQPASEARPFMLAASVVAVLLLLNGGVLASGIAPY